MKITTLALALLATVATQGVARAEGYSTASDDDKTLTMTLVNNTSQTLTFAGVAHPNPGNQFAVSATTVAPGASIVITGVITVDFDLGAFILFNDNSGEQIPFQLTDPRYFHAREPEFMINSRFQASVTSKTLGAAHARALLIKAATVVLTGN